MQFSIVATLHRSAEHLPQFLDRVHRVADRIASDYETILVNDASPDESLSIALDHARRNPCIRVIDLARRYGHYEAMLAGIRHARGDSVFLIDSDLEEPPELLEPLWEALRNDPDVDLVVACQKARRGRSFVEWGGGLYYRVLRAQMELDIPRDNLVARLMTRRYVNALLATAERVVSFDALCGRVGFRHRTILAVKERRGSTTYSFSRRAWLFIDSLLAYGTAAATVTVFLGLLVFVAGVAALLFRPSTLALILLIAIAILIVGLGLVFRSLHLLMEEIRHRPAQVRRVYPDDTQISG